MVASIYDIAERAGVAPSTVSRALRDHARISKETRTRIKQIADEMGFRIPAGFRFVSYVQGKCGVELRGNNIRDCIDQLPDTLRRYKGKPVTAAA